MPKQFREIDTTTNSSVKNTAFCQHHNIGRKKKKGRRNGTTVMYNLQACPIALIDTSQLRLPHLGFLFAFNVTNSGCRKIRAP